MSSQAAHAARRSPRLPGITRALRHVQGTTYRGKLVMSVCARQEGSAMAPISIERSFGLLPIMLQSRLCHLRGRTRDQLVKVKEVLSNLLCIAERL
jgi:hypothetical protein